MLKGICLEYEHHSPDFLLCTLQNSGPTHLVHFRGLGWLGSRCQWKMSLLAHIQVDDILKSLGIKISRPQKGAAMAMEGADYEKEGEGKEPLAKKQCVELADGSIGAVGED